ncbi:unnamed protein product, partial [Porites lobata]
VLCPRGWLSSFYGGCFKVHFNSLDWNSAKSACEALGSSLAVLNSKAELREFTQLLKSAGASEPYWWIGLYRDPKNKGQWLWVGGLTAYFTPWDTAQPDNFNSNEDCVEFRMKSEKWNDRNCYNIRIPYICEINGCPLDWTKHQSSCYKLSSNSLEWIAAKFACEALGSNLAMLDSPAEQREIGWGNRTWIGLHRDSSNNSRWQWIDGSLAVYLNFANQSSKWNGTEDCVEMYPSRKWNVLNCNTSLHYSCELSSG